MSSQTEIESTPLPSYPWNTGDILGAVPLNNQFINVNNSISTIETLVSTLQSSISNVSNSNVISSGSTTPRTLSKRFADRMDVRDFGVVVLEENFGDGHEASMFCGDA